MLGGTWFHILVLYLLVEELVFDFLKLLCINKSKQAASVENISSGNISYNIKVIIHVLKRPFTSSRSYQNTQGMWQIVYNGFFSNILIMSII